MNLHQYIINDIKPININDKISDVKLLLSQLTYSHIPVENNGVYMGCISDTDAHCFESHKVLADCHYAIEGF